MKYVISAILLCASFLMVAQEDSDIQMKGYIKDMVTFQKVPGEWLSDNLVHNRLNFYWYASDQWTFRMDVRNRIFTGDQVRNPFFGEFIDSNDDYADMSVLIDEDRIVAHSMIDRLYAEYSTEKFNVRVGRQRINWGLNLVWNPNDIFNAYSFFDFDYEERPGSDALRMEYFLDYASSVEFAVAMARKVDEMTIGGMYKFNTNEYDVQVLGGYMKDNLVIGGGWAGNLGLGGFKGEATYFYDLVSSKQQVLASTSVDYSFTNSLYLNGSVLYNSRGKNELGQIFFDPSRLDVRSLSPYKFSYFLQSSFQLTPLFMLGLSGMMYQDQSYFIMPFMTYSILKNLDFDTVAQLYYPDGDVDDVKAYFLRLKYSF